MRRCPKCNRTYTNDAQKFCTKDGMSLVDASTSLGETVRLDSSELKTTQDDPEVTKVISKELPSQPIEEFDPYKTVISRSQETRTGSPLSTADLMSPSIPPPPTSAISPPPGSGPIEPPPPPPPASIPRPSGPISSPSQPLQNASGDLGQMTMASFAPPPLAAPPSGQLSAAAPAPVPAPVAATKKSKLPLVLGILAVLLVLGLGGAGAAYWFVVRPMLEARRVVNVNPEPPKEPTPIVENTPTESGPKTEDTVKEVPAYTPPADAVQFVNSKDKLDGKLAEHYVDFSFYYPERWQTDPKAGVRGATNFAKVQRQLAADAPQEIFAVGWYESTGAADTDQVSYPRLVEQRSAQFAKEYPEYQKISEGATKVGVYDAYEFRFSGLYRNTDRGDIKIWGRVIFVPPVDGSRKGVTLLMLASSLASELKTVDDVGVKGELPMMLESFRFGK
jgi:hypothetical protein